MAKGPKSADVAQNYILKTMQSALMTDDTPIPVEITDPQSEYNGQEEYSIGEVFSDNQLRKLDSTDEEHWNFPSDHTYEFEALDEVYDAVKTTNAGRTNYSKLDGLRSINESIERPTSNKKTWYNWRDSFEESGLILDGEITDKGEMMIETTKEVDEKALEDLDTSAGEIYRELTTRGYGSTEANNGKKIQSFLLYGSGLSHTKIAREIGIAEGTARTMAENMEEKGLYTQNHMFTPQGRDFAQIMLKQLEEI